MSTSHMHAELAQCVIVARNDEEIEAFQSNVSTYAADTRPSVFDQP